MPLKPLQNSMENWPFGHQKFCTIGPVEEGDDVSGLHEYHKERKSTHIGEIDFP